MTEQYNPADKLIKVQGKSDYLQVKHRIRWFRTEHADGLIVAELTHYSAELGYAVVHARATIPSTGGHSENYGSAFRADLEKRGLPVNDLAEVATTTAIGRALAGLGYGTEDAVDEAGPVDAPHERQGNATNGQGTAQNRPPRPAQAQASARQATTHANASANGSPLRRAKKACWDKVQAVYPDADAALAVLADLLRTSSGRMGATLEAGSLTDWEKLAGELANGKIAVPAPEPTALEPLF